MTPEQLLSHLPGISRALSSCDDPESVEDVLRRIATDKQVKLWGDAEACIVTEKIDTQSTIHFWIATGRLDAVIRLSREILEYARGQGCRRASLTGRRGWVRALEEDGWKETSVVMQKEIPANG